MTQESLHLCIDIGNTRFKLALFSGDELIELKKCKKNKLAGILANFDSKNTIKGMIVSTTRKKIPNLIKEYGKQLSKYIELSDKTPIPIKISYDTPETLGRDRIAAAVGADSLYPDEGNIVIDAGTCITYDFIDGNGQFMGGNIAPGIRMRIEAMHDHTANLPLVDPILNKNELGQSTKEALQNGAVRGTIYEIDSFIRLIENKYGISKTILTGGDAFYFVDYFKSKIFVVQNLVLIGLNKILHHNA